MDLLKLEKMTELVKSQLLRDEAISRNITDESKAKVLNILNLAGNVLPDHIQFFKVAYADITKEDDLFVVSSYVRYSISILEHIIDIIKIEKESTQMLKNGKVFDSANEKIKQASVCFKKGEYDSAFNNLNTALELALKDKLGIPTTITGINTSKIIEILVSDKVEPYLYLNEIKKHVVIIDNKVKHQAYSPTKIDCINAIKAMEELMKRLDNKDLKIGEETRNRIYSGI